MMDQDEKAMLLMDDLFAGRARKLPEVIAAFDHRGIPGCADYLKMYGITTTRKEVEGTDARWCYKGSTQIERVKNDVWAGWFLAQLIMQWDGKIPVRLVRSSKAKYHENVRQRQALSRCLKDQGYYNTGSFFEFVGYELHDEDREWFFEELKWSQHSVDHPPVWPMDATALWSEFGDMWHERITYVAAHRCIEIANLHRSTDVKAIFPIGS